MFVVAISTSTLFFFISPLGNASSELLARTTPTTYDVLIAFSAVWPVSWRNRARIVIRPLFRALRSLRR